jgi:predicted hydrocarbon binding protein
MAGGRFNWTRIIISRDFLVVTVQNSPFIAEVEASTRPVGALEAGIFAGVL